VPQPEEEEEEEEEELDTINVDKPSPNLADTAHVDVPKHMGKTISKRSLPMSFISSLRIDLVSARPKTDSIVGR
jgi:hypothetical protein